MANMVVFWSFFVPSCLLMAIMLLILCTRSALLATGDAMPPPPPPGRESRRAKQVRNIVLNFTKPVRRPETRQHDDAACPICLEELYPRPAPVVAAGGADAVDVDVEAVPTPWTPPRDDVVALKACSHRFHRRCLAGWILRSRGNCPLCRTDFDAVPARANEGVSTRAATYGTFSNSP